MLYIPGVRSWGDYEKEILEVLSDGRQHPMTKFYHHPKRNPNNHNTKNSAYHTIQRIRRKLEPTGYGVVIEMRHRQSYVRLVQFINPEE